jgi:hypothetical protein
VITNNKQVRVRRDFFIGLLFFIITIYFTIDYFNLFDECLTMYYLEMSISFSCAMLYAWWWWKSGSASDVYRWLTILFFAQVIRLIGNIIVRTEYIIQNPSEGERLGFIIDSYMWTFRNFPELIVLIFMLALILGRLYCNIPAHKCLHED